MRKIDWNKASDLGLIVRINKEILHPLGLAMFRDTDNGNSQGVFVSPDKEFHYDPDPEDIILTKAEIHALIGE